jgi:hypothetical protein
MRSMLPLLLWVVLQSSPGQPVQFANPLLADCSGERDTQGCKSFNELVEAKDDTVLKSINHDSYVCFRSEADVFSIISFHQATSDKFNFPMVGFHFFKNGNLDDFKAAYGKWRRQSEGSFIFEDAKAPPSKQITFKGHASITDDEVTFRYSFENLNSKTTDYAIQIRRSTLRFTERYEAPNGKDKTYSTDTFTGHCVAYPH